MNMNSDTSATSTCWTGLRQAMAAEGIVATNHQDVVITHLERTGLGDDEHVDTLLLLAKDFVERPEVFSQLLISDFQFPPLVAHQTRAVVMGMLQRQQKESKRSRKQTSNTMDRVPTNDTKTTLSEEMQDNDDDDDTSIEWEEATVAPFPSIAVALGANCDAKKETPARYTGFKNDVVNEKASQRRRKEASVSYEYGLSIDYETTYPILALELQGFYKFMVEPSPQSQEVPIKPATANVYFLHAKLFLGWFVFHTADHVSLEQNKLTTLSIFTIIPNKEKESAQTFIDFVMWLRSERQISAGYEANLLRGLIKLLKFRFCKESETESSYGGTSFTDIPLIREIRKLHRTANQKQRNAPKSSDEKKKWLAWPEYLQVIQKTKEETLELIESFHQHDKTALRYRKADTERRFSLDEEDIAATFQRYLILAIFASIPDRQRTIRELEIGRTLVKENDTYYVKHGPDDYKTGKSYGERPPLQLAPELTSAIDEFIEKWRPALRPSTDFLFVQARTGKPMTGDSVFDRVTRSCFKYTGKRTNPHLLRSMIITHVREMSNASEKELEALALFMGHSIQMQRSSYDKRTLKKKIAPAVQLIQNVNNDIDKDS